MNLKYFFSLYLRNAWGTFINPFILGGMLCLSSGTAGVGVLILWSLHVVLLPLTLTLGAGIKTIVDYYTRVFTPQEELETKKDVIIANITTESLDKLSKDSAFIEESEKCFQKSNSTRALLIRLSEINTKAVEDYEPNIQARKKALKLHQLGEDAEKKYTPDWINDLEFDQTHQEQYDADCPAMKVLLENRKIKQTKEAISAYINDENNNGKKLFQIIVGFFGSDSISKNTRACLQF